MKLLGVDLSPNGLGSLPPKIWRAVILDLCGLPVTDYLIADLFRVSREEAARSLVERLRTSKHGVVVRTVTWEDGKNQPYLWLPKNRERDVVEVVDKRQKQYLLTLANQTNKIIKKLSNSRATQFLRH